MAKEKVLIVGLGEVGHTLFELFKESGKFDIFGFDINKKKLQEIVGSEIEPPKMIDVLHICYPCFKQAEFIQTTTEYIKRINPKLTIIESTIPPGTTQKIYAQTKMPIVHSPIQGTHTSLENMKSDIRFWPKYIGSATIEAKKMAHQHFEKLGLNVQILKSPIETELAKLFETIYRAWMIACFQEMHRISRHFNADFDEVIEMIDNIHRHRLNKPLHYPDVIGGHCLIPNTELLLSVYDSDFLRLILKSNEKRREEIKDAQVRKEVEKVKRRVEKLEEEIRRRR
jgi:UDP-N-acetyl-D-mannosaminuronate dehydrogenase